jgi:hypothetical protein
MNKSRHLKNLNPWLLTFDHVLFDVSHVANTINYDCICVAISGREIFFTSNLFVLHQDFKTSPTNAGGQFYPFLSFGI